MLKTENNINRPLLKLSRWGFLMGEDELIAIIENEQRDLVGGSQEIPEANSRVDTDKKYFAGSNDKSQNQYNNNKKEDAEQKPQHDDRKSFKELLEKAFGYPLSDSPKPRIPEIYE